MEKKYKSRIKWTDEEKQDMIQMYREDNNLTRIGNKYNVSHKTIRRVLNNEGIEINSNPLKKLTPEKIQEIINCYNSKKITLTDLSKQFKISTSVISRLLHDNNIEVLRKGTLSPQMKELIIIDYKSGMLRKEIGNKYNISCSTIDNLVRNEELSRSNFNRELDHNFFDINNLNDDSAYFAGYLLADGWIREKSNQIQMELGIKDKCILEIFSYKIHNTNKLSHRIRDNGFKDSNTLSEIVSLRFSSAKMKQDLAYLGITPNKTFTARLSKNIPDHLMGSFLRGLFDGDGWISSQFAYAIKKMKVEYHRSIGLCGNYELINDVKQYLIDKLNVNNVGIYNEKSRAVAHINWYSNKDVIAIGEFLYANKNDCYLPRKYLKYQQIKAWNDLDEHILGDIDNDQYCAKIVEELKKTMNIDEVMEQLEQIRSNLNG